MWEGVLTWLELKISPEKGINSEIKTYSRGSSLAMHMLYRSNECHFCDSQSNQPSYHIETTVLQATDDRQQSNYNQPVTRTDNIAAQLNQVSFVSSLLKSRQKSMQSLSWSIWKTKLWSSLNSSLVCTRTGTISFIKSWRSKCVLLTSRIRLIGTVWWKTKETQRLWYWLTHLQSCSVVFCLSFECFWSKSSKLSELLLVSCKKSRLNGSICFVSRVKHKCLTCVS